MHEGRPAEAEPWLRRVLQADPFDVEAQFTLISCLEHQGRSQEAADALARYQESKSLLERANRLLKDEASRASLDPDAAATIGADFLRIGQPRLGLYWLHQALERSPAHAPAHRALADYYESRGDADKAAVHRRRLAPPPQKAVP
ncbi:MAG: tetratricopeptide repeat protein [Gemmataceae bacterium]|nr:tetratricopeptide repeat protein [Gemmataceae bacterium]